MGVHLLGVAVWVGGLAALALMWRTLGRDLSVTVARYSVLAGWAYALVAISGVQQAILRVGSWSAVTSAYGLLVAARRSCSSCSACWAGGSDGESWPALPSGPSGRGPLSRASRSSSSSSWGLRPAWGRALPQPAASARQPAPAVDRPHTHRVPRPGPMLAGDWFTAWRINWLFLGIAILAVGLYVAGVVRLRRRGDAWPWWRTALWVAGWLVWVYFTCGAPDIWGRVLFSTHMLMHGRGHDHAAASRARRPDHLDPSRAARPHRQDLGPTRTRAAPRSLGALKLLANPIVAATLFFVSLAIFYWSPAFRAGPDDPHRPPADAARFVLTGYLFVWVLIGTDPGPPRWSPLMLLVILFATISFHAFFGVALTDSQTLLAPGFFERINLPWGRTRSPTSTRPA